MTDGELYTGEGATYVRLITVVDRLLDGRGDDIRAADERPPARPPLLAAITLLLPNMESSIAWAGAIVATFPKMNEAASTDAATFLDVSSLLLEAIWRDVIAVFGEDTGANADAPETQRSAMTVVKDLNIILIGSILH